MLTDNPLRPDQLQFRCHGDRQRGPDQSLCGALASYEFPVKVPKHPAAALADQISCPSRGAALADTLPTMLVIATPNIGRQTTRPVWVNAADKFKPEVRVGNPKVEEYLDSVPVPVLEKPAATPKAPGPAIGVPAASHLTSTSAMTRFRLSDVSDRRIRPRPGWRAALVVDGVALGAVAPTLRASLLDWLFHHDVQVITTTDTTPAGALLRSPSPADQPVCASSLARYVLLIGRRGGPQQRARRRGIGRGDHLHVVVKQPIQQRGPEGQAPPHPRPRPSPQRARDNA